MAARVIGIGNRLRGDDAAGPLVAERLRERPGLDAVEHTGESLALIDAWDGADAVVLVDAVRSGAEPGRIHRVDLTAEPLALSSWTFSTHAFSLSETLELARVTGRLPGRVVFFGVEAASFAIGAPPSAAVEAALPELCDRVAREAAPRPTAHDP